VLFYCGANDIQDGNATPGIVNADNTIKFLKKVSKKLKASKIYYISINHSIRNKNAWGEIDTSNRIVKQFCIKEKNIYYINIVNASVLADGTPNPALFTWDGLHPSKQGFKVWNTVIGDRINRSR
jgi:lysophospholipase L1-like esterase